MVKILPIGHLIGIDQNGYLINDCDASRISSPWLGLVEAWKAGCLDLWGDRLHSLYLRGSVPRGMAMPKLSDLDGVVILQDSSPASSPTVTATETARRLATLTQRLLRQYRFCRNIETVIFSQCAWISRRLVRVGFELIMEQEQAYTRDLYPCYQRFAAHFPALEPQMRQALALAIAPSRHRAGLLLFLAHLGEPLLEQVQRTFTPSTPECFC